MQLEEVAMKVPNQRTRVIFGSILNLRRAVGAKLGRWKKLHCAIVYGALFLPLVGVGAGDVHRPNIIFILTDDQGFADLGCQGVVKDIRTPNLDRLASEGVRCTSGYITAPQCSPSRAGLITGRYQQRFGFDTIPDCPLPLEEVTIAERLHAASYVNGMVGKWHLDPNVESSKWIAKNLPGVKRNARGQPLLPRSDILSYYPQQQGFDEFFVGSMSTYYANFALNGSDLSRAGEWVDNKQFRVDVQTDAALAFIRRNHAKPFFLYLAYFAPHVPLEAPDEYLKRFTGPMPERRRHALAMLAAVDDGVGRILAALKEEGIDDNTLLVFTSDNGAPLKLSKEDVQPDNVSTADWDGSLNDPWVGEKGMLAEGGIHVPFLLRWKGGLPAGKVFAQPVSSLDIAATAIAAAGLPADAKLDGVNLLPYLNGQNTGAPHDALFWRFWSQAAVRAGQWKYLKAGSAEFLFDLASDAHETTNLLAGHSEVASQLRSKLTAWTQELTPPGLPARPVNTQEEKWYDFYLHTPTKPESSGAAQTKPNILFILIEDQGAHLGCRGTPGLKTPNLDRLAAEGTLFREAFVGYPVCSPSKACIYTGLYPHENGLRNNTQNYPKPAAKLKESEKNNPIYKNVRMRETCVTWVEVLKQQGYFLGQTGKLHVAPVDKFPYDVYLAKEDGGKKEVGKDLATEFLRRASAAGKPWMLFHNAITTPHRPYRNSDVAPIGVDPKQVRLPAFLPDTPIVRQDWAEYLDGIQLADAAVGEVLEALRLSGQEKNTLVVCVAGDHGPAFPHGKMTPYDLALRVNLIIRAPGGKTGQISDALVSTVDLLPTILDYAGASLPQPVDGLTLRPLLEGLPDAKGHDLIFAEVTGQSQANKPGMEERSVYDGRYHLIFRDHLDLTRSINADSRDWETWRNRTYGETLRVKEQFPVAFRILTEMEPHRYGVKLPACELYDVKSDPDEMTDLAASLEHRDTRQRLLKRLAQWCKDTQDTFITSDSLEQALTIK
jgi:arylsulfatase A-like enzyme